MDVEGTGLTVVEQFCNDGQQLQVSVDVTSQNGIVGHRTASHRTASHRTASHRTASLKTRKCVCC